MENDGGNSIWQTLLGSFRGQTKLAKQIRELIDGNEFGAAKALIAKARSRFPASPRFKILAARSALLSDDRTTAGASLLSVSLADVHGPESCFELAECLRKLQRYDEAVAAYREVMQDGPVELQRAASQALLSCYLRLDQPKLALDVSVQCVRLGGWHHQHSLMNLSQRCSILDLENAIVELQAIDSTSDPWINNNRFKMISYFALATSNNELANSSIQLAAKASVEAHHPELKWDDSAELLRPSVLVIGAMKAGTSALFNCLLTHPQFVTPQYKELHFFDQKNQTIWSDEYYLNQFPRVRNVANRLVTGEASPGYYAFDAVDRMKELLPGAKLIFMKRDPVDRAVSHLFHNRNTGVQEHPLAALTMGYEAIMELVGLSEIEFRVALQKIETGELPINRFVLMGCYELLLRPWRRTFGDQLLVVHFDDFSNDINATMDRVFDFVGLDPHPISKPLDTNAGRYDVNTEEMKEVRNKLSEFYRRVDRELGV
jgi:hypothetical protein